jgi:hypothetical protein
MIAKSGSSLVTYAILEMYQTFTRPMTIEVSRAGISGTNIRPDTPEWAEWFTSAPEGTKIQFTWADDSFREQRFTAYRRKRYWEAQKRVLGRLRNTTIKPGEVTHEALRQMGLRLTAYNWADKFENEESGKREEYQTSEKDASQTVEEIAQLKAEIDSLREKNLQLKSQLAEAEDKYINIHEVGAVALDEYLNELGGIPVDDKGKPKARYDQLAKFRDWLHGHYVVRSEL